MTTMIELKLVQLLKHIIKILRACLYGENHPALRDLTFCRDPFKSVCDYMGNLSCPDCTSYWRDLAYDKAGSRLSEMLFYHIIGICRQGGTTFKVQFMHD